MILPIVPYGKNILRKKCVEVSQDYPGLTSIIDNMWATLSSTYGVGLAAPQVNLGVRMFIIDGDTKKTFINPYISSYSVETCVMTEGCLSIPGIGEKIQRPSSINISYFDIDFMEHIEFFDGLDARIIQHEYDHIEGKLFIDYLSGLSKRLIKSKLNNIMNNNVITKYKML